MNGDPSGEDLAAKRFMIINMVRFAGVGIAAFGAAITAGAIEMPEMIGYVLIAAGAIDALVVPTVLARAWKSPRP